LKSSAFYRVAEKEKTLIINKYFELEPDRIEQHLVLLESVDADLVKEELNALSIDFISRLALKASKGLRTKIVESIDKESSLFLVAQRDLGVRRLLAELFSVVAVDSLEDSDLERANFYLTLSDNLVPSLESNLGIRKYLNRLADVEPEPIGSAESQPAPKPREQSFSERVSRNRTKVASGIGGIVVWIVITLAVLFVGFKLFLAYLGKRSSKESDEIYSEDYEKEHQIEDVESGQEIEFDDLSELDAILDDASVK
jgi:hypothetical protein